MGNISNKKMFNNYVKNKGDVFDPNILKDSDPFFNKRKNNSRIKNRSGKENFYMIYLF